MADRDKFDVIIVGGGSAGMAASMWCAKLGLTAILIEKEGELGGQLLRVYGEITDYPGVTAKDGRELRDLFVEKVSVDRLLGTEIDALDVESLSLETVDGRSLSGRAIIIATGVRRRILGIPGECEFVGRGVLDSGVLSRGKLKGKVVVIVGGGDAALENAMILSDNAKKVIVVHRRDEFSARTEFIDSARALENVEFVFNSEVAELIGNEWLTAVKIQDESSRNLSQLNADAVLIRIGVEPDAGLVKGIVELDAGGYIRVNERCETSMPGIYAVGDVASPTSPTIATAVGMGATAAKNIFQFLNK